MTAQAIYPFAVWESGTLNNSVPANDNSLRSQVKDVKALGIANSAPGSPSENDQWVVGTTWGGFTTDNIVVYKGGTWLEFEPFNGQFKKIGNDVYSYDGGWTLSIPGQANSVINIVTISSNNANETADRGDAGSYIRFTGTGSKSYSFDTSDGWDSGDRIWVSNRSGSGTLSITGTGVTFNSNPGPLDPGDSLQVIFTSTTTADVVAYGGGGGGGGGGYLQEVTVSSAQQDIDFTSLNLSTDKQYRIEILWTPNASESQEISCYFNADTTAGNYRRVRLNGITNAASAAIGSNAGAIVGSGVSADANYVFSAALRVSQIAGKYPQVVSLFGSNETTTGNNVGASAVHRLNTANVTSIKLRHVGNFGVGTRARIYKD